MFLTPEQVQELTGYRKPAKQIEWLRDKGYHFYINGKNLPVVYDDLPRVDLSLRDIVARAESCKKLCGVYFLIGGSHVLYVGKSYNIQERIAAHHRTGAVGFDCFSYIECSRKTLSSLEAKYIAELKPPFNKMGKC